ncbi:hypothetical protein LTT02_25500 [Mycolicibacterium smegmatis]|uniref:hypothetical protein n=1 Tax=Mycolicibacterium smegmatis TaxID=1772 RepID=UPI0005D81CA8|nr:hypothetical protein [Mycolicibacterium smegmatis]MDF1903613.1 hypothetical protein [Mycolicibacterium smegmatis]MDF1910139.1 hypothetical protein [Mycolicibacterium smegmatis]MDF1921990.1 hypothetical protein [Mycolicibacterium smegmatis]MDF1928487.1 hypothetical protein [Mycolicibacterium smegmatis]UAK57077.1 hypothetical protein K8P01_10290 [Mycolicibacterium smegmatis]
MTLQLNDTQAAALFEVLGLSADTADVDLVVATAQDLAAQADTLESAKPSAVAAAAARNGMELLDKDTAEALRRDAQEGRRIAAAAARARVEAAVADAIDKGKITPDRHKHWVTLIEADPGMADVLAAVPNETVVPMSEIGHSTDNPDVAQSTTWFY